MSLDVLYVLNNKPDYDRYNKFIKEHLVSEELRVIIKDLKKYYADVAQLVDWSNFETWFKFTQHPSFSEDKVLLYNKIFDQMKTHVPTKAATDIIINNFVARDHCMVIGELGMKGGECNLAPEDALESIASQIEIYDKEVDKISKLDKFFVKDSLEELFDKLDNKKGYEWRMECLNKALGHLKQGNLIIFGARPDSGKTSWLCNEMTNMANQLEKDERILWVNNEESGDNVKWRIIQSALNKNDKDLRLNKAKYIKDYTDMMNGDIRKIDIFDRSNVSVHDVDDILKNSKYKIIIFDQLWKVHGFNKEAGNEVTRQSMLFNWAREVSKEYGPVIAVHQLGSQAEGEKWCTMDMLYGSQTAIQGEADAIITMGRTYDAADQYKRFLFIPKNKLNGSDQSLRNGKFEVIIHPEVARYSEPIGSLI